MAVLMADILAESTPAHAVCPAPGQKPVDVSSGSPDTVLGFPGWAAQPSVLLDERDPSMAEMVVPAL